MRVSFYGFYSFSIQARMNLISQLQNLKKVKDSKAECLGNLNSDLPEILRVHRIR